MLNITITEQTPHNMLRAIRAACNELLGETHADLTTQAAQHNSRANELHAAAESETDMAAACLTATNEASALKQAFGQAVEKTGDAIVAKMLTDDPGKSPTADEILTSSDVDSSGAEWNPELHASTKAKNQDGTWKKRRGAGQAPAAGTDSKPEVEEMLAEHYSQTPALPPGGQVPPSVPDAPPPLPPTPPATPLVTMNDIYALISGGKCVLNDVIAGAQAMGFADVGAFSRDATPEQRAQLLQELTA